MFNIKRFLSVVLVMTLISSSIVFADDNNLYENEVKKTDSYYEIISEYTGIEVVELKKIEKEYGNLMDIYGIHFEENAFNSNGELMSLDEFNKVSVRSSDDDPVDPMSDSDWQYLTSNLEDGDILITKDSSTGPVNHGHGALVDDVYSSNIYIVEAYGYGSVSDRHKMKDNWRNYNRVRVYYPDNLSSSVRDDVGTYAGNNLQDWDYDAFADVTSSNYLNCVTLAYKAYKSENYNLQTSLVVIPNGTPYPNTWYTVYPNDIVTDSNNTMRLQVNWSGNSHKW